VTVPTTNLTATMRVQKRRNCSSMTRSVRIALQVKDTRQGPSPIVTTGKTMWTTVVRADCSRLAGSTTGDLPTDGRQTRH
jgi:hypothetical protein